MADFWLSAVHLDRDGLLPVFLAELLEQDILAHLPVDSGEAVDIQPSEELLGRVVDVEQERSHEFSIFYFRIIEVELGISSWRQLQKLLGHPG